MLTWIVYDISKDRTRTKLAKAILGKGLYRVQQSVYLGNVDSNQLDEILLKSEELMDETDSVYAFPMCEDDFRKVRMLGQGFERELVMDELLTKVI